jgi:hypothetical protein
MSSEVVLSLQTTLPAAKVGPTTFCFRFLATSNHSEWPDVGKISKAWLTLLCLLDAQTPALKLVTIESLDGALAAAASSVSSTKANPLGRPVLRSVGRYTSAT